MASKPKKSTTKKPATKQSSKNKGGRPRIEIDKDKFEYLCGLMCTEEEIAGLFRCSVDTIERWCQRTYNSRFAETFKVYSANGKISLRRLQFKLAEKSAAMAIFLGKQYLGQQDHIEVVDNTPVERLDAILAGVRATAELTAHQTQQEVEDGRDNAITETE